MSIQETAPTTAPEAKEAANERSLSLLAREHFGDAFKGELKESEENKSEESEASKESAEDTTEAESKEDTEESSETNDEASEQESSDESEADESFVAESIEHYDWDRDWSTIKVPVKVDDQTSEVPIGDLVRSYQIGEAAEKRLEEAKTLRSQAKQELESKQQELHGQFATAAKLIENAERLLDQDSSRVDWQALRHDDPAEYSAKKAEMADRRQEIERMKREAVESYQTMTAEQRKQQQEHLQTVIAAEAATLVEKLPEWRDESVAKAEKTKIVGYLKSQGFADQDIMNAYDHKAILIARKAMLYDEGQTKVSAAKKKLALVPKVMKPGAPKSSDQINQERVNKAKAQLQKSGSLDDAYAVLVAQRGK